MASANPSPATRIYLREIRGDERGKEALGVDGEVGSLGGRGKKLRVPPPFTRISTPPRPPASLLSAHLDGYKSTNTRAPEPPRFPPAAGILRTLPLMKAR